MWSLFEKAVHSSAAALDLVKRDVGDFCKTLSDDTNNYMQGTAATPFGQAKGTGAPPRPAASELSSREAAVTGGGTGDPMLAAAGYDHQQARLETMQNDVNTYCKPPEAKADFAQWSKGFDFDKHSSEIAQLLIKQNIRSLHAKLVPSQVSYREFWLRYFFCEHLLKKDAERHAALKAFASQAVQNTLDDWSDGDDGWDGADDDWVPAVTAPTNASKSPAPTLGKSSEISLASAVSSSITTANAASTSSSGSRTSSSSERCSLASKAMVSASKSTKSTGASSSALAEKREERRPTPSPVGVISRTTTSSQPKSEVKFQTQASSECSSSQLSSSSEPSSPMTSSPPNSPQSPSKALGPRTRRPRSLAHQKVRVTHMPVSPAPKTSQHHAHASLQRRKSSETGVAGLPTMSSSSSLADDEAMDSQETEPSLQGDPVMPSVQSSLADGAYDETSGSEIVVLNAAEACQSPPSLAVLDSVSQAALLARMKSSSSLRVDPFSVTSPPPSSAGSDFELISETEPSETLSPARRSPLVGTAAAAAAAAAVTVDSLSPSARLAAGGGGDGHKKSGLGVLEESTPARAVSSDTTLQASAVPADVQGANEEDWESWD